MIHNTHPIYPNQTKHLKETSLVYPGLNVPTEGIANMGQYAVANKWIAYVPLSLVLGPSYSNVELQLKSFTLPKVEVGKTSIQYRSVTLDIPTHVMEPESKELTFNYFIQQDWSDYRALYSWAMNLSPVNEGLVTSLEEDNANANGLLKFIDVDIDLIDAYKNVIVRFIFKNCWITNFSDLQLTYANANEIEHSFTMAYSHFEIADLASIAKKKKSWEAMSETDRKIAEYKEAAKTEFLQKYGGKIQPQW